VEAKNFMVTAQNHPNVHIPGTSTLNGKSVIDSGTDHLLLPRNIAKLIHDNYDPPVPAPTGPCE
jgi:hypothetical protein